MKAAICTRYGPPEVLRIEEVDKPVPRKDEVLIRIRAANVTAGDSELRGMRVSPAMMPLMRMGFGISAPRARIIGQEFAGEVESVGDLVTKFKDGDAVFGWTGLRLGAYAEYDCLPGNGIIAFAPKNASFEEAAALPIGALHSVHMLRAAKIAEGKELIVIGAGGAIGTMAVQIAKVLGARVTAVDRRQKLDRLLSIGADEVIDYTTGDYTKSGMGYDAVMDVAGKTSYSALERLSKDDGTLILCNPSLSQMIRKRWSSLVGKGKVVTEMSYKTDYLEYVGRLVEEGKVSPVIDRKYPLSDIVEAHRFVDSGEKVGNVVVTIG